MLRRRKNGKRQRRLFATREFIPVGLTPPNSAPQNHEREIIIIAESPKHGQVFNCDLWDLVEAKCRVMRGESQNVPDDLQISVTIGGSHRIHEGMTFLAKNPTDED